MEGVWVVCCSHKRREQAVVKVGEWECPNERERERERKKVDAIKMMKPEQELFLMQF